MNFGLCKDAAQTELLEEFTYTFTYDALDTVKMADKHGNNIQLSWSQGSQVRKKSLSCSMQTCTHANMQGAESNAPL